MAEGCVKQEHLSFMCFYQENKMLGRSDPGYEDDDVRACAGSWRILEVVTFCPEWTKVSYLGILIFISMLQYLKHYHFLCFIFWSVKYLKTTF